MGALARLFARELPKHIATLGGDGKFGPALTVRVIELRRWKKGVFSPSYSCRMTARVNIGRLQRDFAAAANISGRWKCVRAVASRVVLQILEDPSVRAEMMSARPPR